jgi:hypothetical protein
MQTNQVEIPFTSKERALKSKLISSVICYGIPFLILMTIVLLSDPQEWYVLGLPVIVLLFAVKTMGAMGHVEVRPNGLLLKRGINRRWKQLREPAADTLVYYTSVKKGSTYVLNISEANIARIELFDPLVAPETGYGTLFEDPDRCPFVKNENILALTATTLSLKDLRPMHAFQRQYPKTANNITIYFSVDSIDYLYKALPRSIQQKTIVIKQKAEGLRDEMFDSEGMYDSLYTTHSIKPGNTP